VQNLLSSGLLPKKLKIKIYEYRTIILPIVLYGCETWSLTLREVRRRVFENRVLKRVFGPKREKVRGECRRLHKVELNYLYSTPNIIRVIKSREMGGACSTTRGDRVLVGKRKGRRPPGRHRRIWVNSTKIDFQEVIRVGGNELDWFGKEEGQVAGCCQ
jgi:hypothetical protein